MRGEAASVIETAPCIDPLSLSERALNRRYVTKRN